MKNIDLKLLEIIGELSRTRSVSHTAENLGLSQSTVSMSLAKLRRHFNDPLFVRTSAGMEPTPHATELIGLLRQAEDLLQSALEHHVVFDARTTDRRFRIESSDIAQVTLLPQVMREIRSTAPMASMELCRISGDTPRLLESGEADLAVGFIPPMGAGFFQQKLFDEQFVCVVRKGHPRITDTLSVDDYQSEQHLVVASASMGHSIVERTLAEQRVTRKIGMVVPNFLGISPLIKAMDYIATLPDQLAKHLAQTADLKILPLPVSIPHYTIWQYWHGRYTHDPANRWLRATVAKQFGVQQNAPASPGPADWEAASSDQAASAENQSETEKLWNTH